jgi:hypothetical protein
MKSNVGTIDRTLRIIGGLALIVLAALGKVGWWGYIGIVPLATGIFRFCPVYTLLGLRTCPLESTKPHNS